MSEACEHKFILLDNKKSTNYTGSYNTHYKVIRIYFCERCLEEKVVKREEWSRETPEWY